MMPMILFALVARRVISWRNVMPSLKVTPTSFSVWTRDRDIILRSSVYIVYLKLGVRFPIASNLHFSGWNLRRHSWAQACSRVMSSWNIFGHHCSVYGETSFCHPQREILGRGRSRVNHWYIRQTEVAQGLILEEYRLWPCSSLSSSH